MGFHPAGGVCVMDGRVGLERAMGIEPTSSAWEAEVLPLNNARETANSRRFQSRIKAEAQAFYRRRRRRPAVRTRRLIFKIPGLTLVRWISFSTATATSWKKARR